MVLKTSEHTKAYLGHVRAKYLIMALFLVLLLILVVIAINVGSIRFKFTEVLYYLLHPAKTGTARIIWEVRLPRILAALVVGSSLSLSGSMMQTVLKNPLASPYTLGISSAAALGASFAIVFLQAGTSNTSTIIINNPYVVSIAAFVASMGATAIILLLTTLTRTSAESLVLAGIAIGSMSSAGLTLMQYIANSVQLSNIVSWTFGDLGRANKGMLILVFAVYIPLLIIFSSKRWVFNALGAGEEVAKALGINTNRVRLLAMIGSSFVASIVVSFFGIISFVGLLGPHIARKIIGDDHLHLFLASSLIGAFVLLAADTIARSILLPLVLPVGIITSLIGGPLFIYLLVKRRSR
jgi:iron complex transport system permease protein